MVVRISYKIQRYGKIHQKLSIQTDSDFWCGAAGLNVDRYASALLKWASRLV
jgi:hypothetical protein